MTEKWKEREQKKGRYVSALHKPFPFKGSSQKVTVNVKLLFYNSYCAIVLNTNGFPPPKNHHIKT